MTYLEIEGAGSEKRFCESMANTGMMPPEYSGGLFSESECFEMYRKFGEEYRHKMQLIEKMAKDRRVHAQTILSAIRRGRLTALDRGLV